MTTKSSDKICLSARESCPPPAYVGRHNHGFESDVEADCGDRIRHVHVGRGQEPNGKQISNGATVKNKQIHSICLCTASIYPHYHGETIIDDNVYDEILIIDPKELQATSNKNVRFKGQCLRLCKFCILIFVILVGLACGLYGVAHYFIVNKNGDALMSNGDVKLLQYSTYFCEGIKAEPSEIQRSLVVLEKKVGHVANFFYNMSLTLTLSPQQRTYEQGFYAIEQGVMRITIESEQDVDVLIFDTDSKLNNWKNNKQYAAYNFKRRCCKDITINRGLYSFRAEQDRRAFFVVYSDGPDNANINLTLSFERSFIDYKRNNVNCFADVKKSCTVPISFASADKVVIEVPRTSTLLDSQKVEWSCEARVWFYVCVFLGIFIAVIIIMCFIYCLLSCCFCDPCCCCFCCYIVAKEEKSNHRVVQYHCGTLRQHPHYVSRTPRGPRARQIEGIRRHDSNSSIMKHGYTTSDTSDTEGRDSSRRNQLSRRSSTTTTHSMVSNQLSRRRSSSSIGSDLKRGMCVDESYEELHPPDAEWVGARGAVANSKLSVRLDDVDGMDDPKGLKRAKMSRRARKGVRKEESNDEYSDIEARLRMKKAQFSDSEGEEGNAQDHVARRNMEQALKQAPFSDDDDDNEYDYTYDVVGFQVPGPSKSTADKIDTLPLGPSGAPPEAPPKSAASIKGKPGLKAVKSLESLEILPNGMTRASGDKLQKSKSDVMQTNPRTRKHSPMSPRIIVLNGTREMYNTCDRRRSDDVIENGLGNRTISLDSGLERIDGNRGPKIRPAADVKF